jgi:hypothetical protein
VPGKADYDPLAKRRPRHSLAINFIKARRTHRQSSYLGTKIKLRQQLLKAMGAQNAHVLDLFAGAGEMHRHVWRHCAAYTGIDEEWFRDERLMYVGDNRAILRAIDLDQFNVFDLDPFGSCWEQAFILASRRKVRPGERVGLALTVGDTLKIKAGSWPLGLRAMMGIGHVPGMASREMDLAGQALRRMMIRMGGRPVRYWQAHSKVGSGLVYMAVVMEGS